jgi:sugar phosphate isomerase/epimerase
VYITASTHSLGDQSFEDICTQFVDLEYDKIELWMADEHSPLKPREIGGNPERFVTLYRETTRLTPVAIHLQNDPGAECFESLCRLGKMLRITQITLPSGVLGTPFNEEIDRLRSRLGIANAAGMRLSLKTETGHLTEDPQTAVELCQAVPGLGLTLDLSHYMVGKYSNLSLDGVYPYVYHVHLRDSTTKQLQVPVGLGEVDYSRMIAHLDRINLCRMLSVEFLPDLYGNADRHLELRKIRMLLETLI